MLKTILALVLKAKGLFSPTTLYVAAVVAASSASAGFYGAWHLKTLSEEAAVSEARKVAIEQTEKADAITYASALETEHVRIQVEHVTDTVREEVKVYVTKKADARCTVPVGAVRVHDDAARGVPPVPAPAGFLDGAAPRADDPSGILLSQILDTVARNYGQYHQVAGRLTELQGWITKQAALAAKGR